MPNEFKETYSHRAKAVRMLVEYLENKGWQSGRGDKDIETVIQLID